MKASDQVGNSAAIADLQGRWNQIKDVDRALAVHKILAAGTSGRALARELHCNESLLRHLNQAAQAPVGDLILARQGKISTRELARRGKEAEKLRAAQDQEKSDQRRDQAAAKAAAVIRAWLEEQQIWSSHIENILEEAPRILYIQEAKGTLPKFTAPQGTPLARIIERTRPKPANADPEPLEVGAVAWLAEWLARWTFFAFPDPVLRDRAFALALNAELRGEPLGKARKNK